MGGRSGSRCAPHTLFIRAGTNHYRASPAQWRIVDRALKHGGTCFVMRGEVRSARFLESIRIGTLEDYGAFGPKKGTSNIDGERWSFTLAENVNVS